MITRKSIRTIQATVIVFILLCVLFFNLNYLELAGEHRQGSFIPGSCQETVCDCPYIGPGIENITNIQQFSLNLDFNDSLEHNAQVIGKQKNKKVYLSIGIPSIKRPTMQHGWSYLINTIHSILKTTTKAQQEDLVIVIFLGDFDEEYKKKVIEQLVARFSEHLASGLLQVLTVYQRAYPPLKGLKRNFNDKPDRVEWRSKQNVDFALMFRYAQNLSQFYMQLEDDVECADNFIDSIKQFISLQKKAWVSLDFSELGFIGKLFKNQDIGRLSQYLMLFYQEQPVDWLIRFFKESMVQFKTIMRKPTLFQHKGLYSSLHGSKNKLADKFFLDRGGSAVNPVAKKLDTNLNVYQKYSLGRLYQGEDIGWFKGPLSNGDYIRVVFETPQNVTAIFVTTGRDGKTDVMNLGKMQVSQHDDCSQWTDIGKVNRKTPYIKIPNLENIIKNAIHCVQIVALESQQSWLIVSDFHIIIK